jgi:hypothetical protein
MYYYYCRYFYKLAFPSGNKHSVQVSCNETAHGFNHTSEVYTQFHKTMCTVLIFMALGNGLACKSVS